MPVIYIQEFEVEGSGNFPLDMLRYDSCYPVREGRDTANLCAREFSRDRLPPRTIRLRRFVFNSQQMPTTGRWESFGWKVVKDSISTRKY
jgi:hypothetical protein